MIRVALRGVGVRAPGFDDWRQASGILSGEGRYHADRFTPPKPDMLAANERRRTTVTIRLAREAAGQAARASGIEPDCLQAVFSSSDGDMEIADKICRALTLSERPVSPTQFHNSVHNAPAGYWSIASGSRCPSTSFSLYEASMSAGLLEAAVQVQTEGAPVILVVYEHPGPQPLNKVEPISAPFAVAMVLTASADGVGREIDLSLIHEGDITRMDDPSLERLRR